MATQLPLRSNVQQLPPTQSSTHLQTSANENEPADHAIAQLPTNVLSANNDDQRPISEEFATVLQTVSTEEPTHSPPIVDLPIPVANTFQREIAPETAREETVSEGDAFANPLPMIFSESTHQPQQAALGQSDIEITEVPNSVNSVNSGTSSNGEGSELMHDEGNNTNSKPETISNTMVNENSVEGSDSQMNKLTKAIDVKKSVTSAVVDSLVQQVETGENGVAKKIVLQLHPAELGQVTLQVDFENDSLRARILTNEVVASEILNQNKQQLVAALAENGLNFDSLDVAYQQSEDPNQGQQDNNARIHSLESEQEANQSGSSINKSNTAIVDIVI